jgi:hypothetical protein
VRPASPSAEIGAVTERNNMESVIKTLAKRLLLSFVVSMGMVILLAHEFGQGILSPRGFKITLLLVAVGMAVWAVFIIKKTATDLGATPLRPPGSPLDEATRKRRLLGIRAGKAMIVLLVASLIFGLSQNGPLVPVLVGAIVNFWMMGALIWWVARLQKSLH